MSIKTKTIAAAALAALALPVGAIADNSHGKERSAAAKSKTSKAKGPKGKAFTIQGVGVTSIPVTDGKLTGKLTMDPTAANSHARKYFDPDLTKTALQGTTTVQFGDLGDAVIVRYVGLESTAALQATDKVKAIGKVARDGKLDIRKITVIRQTEETQTTTTPAS